MTLNIVSWNINSVRLRAHSVLKAANMMQADVICLQETKSPDNLFPYDTFRDAGYTYIHANGMKGYNGVAIISRIPFENNTSHRRVDKDDCRHASVTLTPDDADAIDIHNLYIPAGGDIPIRDENDKFDHKLSFVEEMTDWFVDSGTHKRRAITLGDFNIAPMEHDVWSSKQLRNTVSHTEPEITRINTMLKSGNWTDSARQFIDPQEKAYSWWSYRNRDWKKSNRGRRLDHIWVTQSLKNNLKSYQTLPEARDWEKPSDHVPIMIGLDG